MFHLDLRGASEGATPDTALMMSARVLLAAAGGGGVGPVMVGGVGGGQALRTELRVPSSAVGAILGRGGTTINNIRQVSGATIKVLVLVLYHAVLFSCATAWLCCSVLLCDCPGVYCAAHTIILPRARQV